jgi:hypothetical protein
MSTQCCQVVPSAERSHRADIVCRSALTVIIERTRTVGASPGLAAGAPSPPPEKWNTPALSTVSRITSTLPSLSKLRARNASPVALTDDLNRSYRLLANHHINVVHEEMSAGQYLVCIYATDRDRRFAATYHIECDAMWRVKMTRARVIGVDSGVDLTSDGAGHWRDEGGVSMPQLDGTIDVDLSITPFTNTLPIRRVDLAEGQAADIQAVYVRLPELTVTIDPQRYTCLQRGRYRYESLDTDFVRDIDIDIHGLVVTYPGSFRRVL